MADGSIDIQVKLDDSQAKSQASKVGNDISKGIESGLKGASNAARNAEKDISGAFKNAGKSVTDQFKATGEAASSSFNGIGKSAQDASAQASEALDDIGQSGNENSAIISGVVAGAFATLSSAALDFAMAAGQKVIDFFKQSVTVGMEFEAAMSQVAATMGVTTGEIGDLTQFANEMGATTAFSATQSAEALNYMALAGYDAETSMAMLPNVLNLAAAGSFDLASASDMVTDAQSALGLSIDETSQMVDKMAKAASKSNTSVEQLGSAFLTVGGTAKNLKGGTTELAAALGILADNGVKGAEGGTALRNIILSLSAPTDVAAEKLEELGISVFDAQGNMRSLNSIFKDFNLQMESLTQEEKTKALNTIFNKVDLKSVNALLANTTANLDNQIEALENTSIAWDKNAAASKDYEGTLKNVASSILTMVDSGYDQQTMISRLMSDFALSEDEAKQAIDAVTNSVAGQGNRFDELTGYIDNAQGAAQKMADTQLDNLAGDVEALGGATESLQIQISDMLNPALRSLTQFATNSVIPAVSSIVSNIDKIAPPIAAAAASFVALKVAQAVLKSIGIEAKTAGATLKAFTINAKATAASLKAAELGGKGFAVSMKGVMSSVLPLLAISAVVEIVVLLADAFEKARQDAETYEKATTGLVEAFDAVDESAENAVDALDNIDTSTAQKSFADLRSEIDANIAAQAELADSIKSTWESINTDASLVQSYVGTIEQLTQKYDENGNKAALNADEQAKLQTAVAALNEITGSNISVIDAQNGILSQSTDAIKANSDAWIANAKAQAAQEELVELERQQIANEKALADAKNNLASANEAYAKAEQMVRDGVEGSNVALEAQQKAVEDAQKALEDAQGTYDSNAEAIQNMADKVGEAGQEMLRTKDAIQEFIEGNDVFSETLQNMGIDVGALSEKLSELGFSTTDLAQMSTEQFMALANSFSGSKEQILAVCESMGIEIPEALRTVGSDSVVGLSEGINSQMETAIAAALQVTGMTRAEFDKLAAEAGIEGSEAVTEFANQIAAGQWQSQGAGQINATMALSGFGSQDGGPAGADMASEFSGGVSGGATDASVAGGSVAAAAGEGLKEQNDNADTWGSHLVSNFAQGISGAIDWAINAAHAVANAVAGILHFSVPKKGIWSGEEKGGERSGRHLVENIAKGMRDAQGDVESAANDVSKAIEDGIISPWENGIDVGGKIVKGIAVDLDTGDGMSQMVDLMNAKMTQAVQSVVTTNVYNNDNRSSMTFNQPVQSPDQFSRALRMQQRYGLAVNRR